MDRLKNMWPFRFTLKKFLKGINHSNEQVREKVLSQLWGVDLSEKDEQDLIFALAGDFHDESTAEEILFHYFRERPREHLIEPIAETYVSLGKHPKARECALRVLTEIQTPESMRALVKLLSLPSGKDVDLATTFIPLKPEGKGRIAYEAFVESLIPTIENLQVECSRYYLLEFLLLLTKESLISISQYPQFPAWIRSLAEPIIRDDIPDYVMFLDWIQTKESDEEWPLSEDRVGEVIDAEDELGLLLHFFKYLPDQNQVDILEKALAINNSTSKLYAIVALANMDVVIPAGNIEEICENKGSQCLLWEHLQSINRLQLFPENLSDQKSLAEAALAHWLAHPVELGHLPHTMEYLTDRVIDDEQDGKCRCYFFRFKKEEDSEWMIGMAGPYPLNSSPRTGGKRTGSYLQTIPEGGDYAEAMEELISGRR